MRRFRIGITSMILVAAFALTGNAHAADEDGCFRTAPNCLSGTTEWSGDKHILRLRNNCGSRVYARFCTLKEDGRESCGASGISSGRTHVWTTYSAHSSGETGWVWVGSQQSSKDWVCSGKVNGWRDSLI